MEATLVVEQNLLTYLITLFTLTFLEIVLGVDNLIFLSIISERLPAHQRKKARLFGLVLALLARLLLLASAIWITKLVTPIFYLFDIGFSWRDLFLIGGGLFLLVKSTQEIHTEFVMTEQIAKNKKMKPAKFGIVIFQIALLDIIFSLDSVITAVGLTQEFWIMAVAILIAIITMIFLSEPLAGFIEKHPTIKMLALAFLLMIGTILIADGFHFHVPRGYIYFAICFSVLVETLNIMLSKKKQKIQKKR